jgi:hypothetical protein
MAYPAVHKLPSVHFSSYIQDISSSTAVENTAIMSFPFVCRVARIRFTTLVAITTADATITISKNGTSVGTKVITQAGSGAGTPQFDFTPQPLLYCSDGDYLTFASDHGSSTRCPVQVDIATVPD